MKTSEKYSFFSKIYSFTEILPEKFFYARHRQRIMKYMNGKILEVGVGTGFNLKYYPSKLSVTAIDFSKGMLEKACETKEKLQLKNIDLQEMDVQKLSFDDSTFDTVYASCVFCTVPDPVKGLKEVYRVLKTDGKAVFFEHMKSNNFILNFFLYMMNIFSMFFMGTSMVRETEINIVKAGFKIEKKENVFFDIYRIIIAIK